MSEYVGATFEFCCDDFFELTFLRTAFAIECSEVRLDDFLVVFSIAMLFRVVA